MNSHGRFLGAGRVARNKPLQALQTGKSVGILLVVTGIAILLTSFVRALAELFIHGATAR